MVGYSVARRSLFLLLSFRQFKAFLVISIGGSSCSRCLSSESFDRGGEKIGRSYCTVSKLPRRGRRFPAHDSKKEWGM